MAYRRPAPLASMEPNVHHLAPRATASSKAAANRLPASPLKKQSDYEVVAPLASKPARKPVASRAAPTTPRVRKDRKKYLCATPPAVLHDLKGRKEYDRGRQLGEGGFARCFLVQNKDGSLFAAKTVSKSSLQSTKMKGKFFGELSVHKTMQHPNVVRFVEVFEDDDNIYMILELCHNKSLMDMLRRRKRFTEPETRFFVLQLMGALKYMHGKRVIHRDLKLGNIFLDANMNIKIGDFGLAALLVDENERKKTICGTPNYIAPEVLFDGGKNGEGHSFEVDLWGVGVIMYAMLVGKPPFQSTDVDSIYKKIKSNQFNWPENVMVSQPAKALVNSLLNRDPNARPSLDEIANHQFFKSGLFPNSIPVSATTTEPVWPSAGNNLAAVTASRAEWKRNYDAVARAAGVGIDSAGVPVEPVGEKPGKPVEPVQLSRPPSAMSVASNECADIGQLLEKKKKEKTEKEESLKANGGYILPETLSPRDGHARMRNMGLIKNVPSRLAALRGTLPPGFVPRREEPATAPQAPGAIQEESEPEDSESEEEEDEDEDEDEEDEGDEPASAPAPVPVARPRQMDKAPMRRTTSETREAAVATARVQISKQAAAAPPARRVTRSHAAQQRAAAVEPAPTKPAPPVQTERPARRPASVDNRRSALAAVSVPVPEPQQLSRPSSVSSLRAASVVESTKEKPSGSSGSPDGIPFGSTLSSRVGKPISQTSTSAVLASLVPTIVNLTAFASGSLRSLPSQPAITAEAVRAFRRGERNRSVFIKKWVDYTNKYGMAYMLSDGTCATLYNDNTSLIVDSIGGERVEWITHSLVEPVQAAPGGGRETVFRRLLTEMSVIKQRSGSSKGLKAKLMIWRKTSNYMNNCLGITEHWGCDRKESVREPSVEHLSNVMLWVTHYARLRRCVVFRLIDGTVQLNFIDHTKLVLTSAARTIRIVTKDNELHVFSLEDVLEICRRGDPLATEFGLKQKILYIKEILRSWHRTGRFPGEIDADDDEPVVILGEGPLD